jgi:hypothetical protein
LSISDFSDMWTVDRENYVLVRSKRDPDDFLIFYLPTKGVALIEDEDEYVEVVQRMRDAGVPVLDELPGEAQSPSV